MAKAAQKQLRVLTADADTDMGVLASRGRIADVGDACTDTIAVGKCDPPDYDR